MSLETIHITHLSEERTHFEFSPDTAKLLDEATPWGYAYAQTLGALSIARRVDGREVELTGTMSDVQDRIVRQYVPRQMAMIAQGGGNLAPYEMQAESYENNILLSLGKLSSTVLPELLHSSTAFSGASHRLTVHFAHALLQPRGVRIITRPVQAPMPMEIAA